MLKYNLGIDQLLYENINLQTYNESDGYCSYQTVTSEENYSVYLFNQLYQEMKLSGWHETFCKPLR